MLAITFTTLGQTIIKICKKLLVTHDFILLSDGLQLVFTVLLIGLGVAKGAVANTAPFII